MPTVTIRPGATDEITIPNTVGWTRTREIGKVRRALITVDRSLIEGKTLNLKEDTITLEGVDTLRLVDLEKGGPTWTLVCYSFEWDANNVAPTTGGDLRTGTDKALIDALVGEVPSWTVGSTTAQTGSLSFVFSHAHRHEALRRIERNVPGEIVFRDSGTVDYVESRGQDKSASVELSASAGTIEESINITDRGRELDGTHFRILGAHEGEAQIYANLVPSDDSATYNNRVDYTTSRWSDGDTRDWDRWVDKDIADQATLDEEASALGEEVSESLVEVKTTTNLSLDVGDWVQVVKPDADLDLKMRVHRVKDVSASGTVVQELELSTRTVVRGDPARDLRKIREFSTGFQGSSVWGTPSGGYQAVTSSDNYRLTFFYPSVEFENTAELYVESQPYRTFHSGAASGGGSTSGASAGAESTNTLSTGYDNVTSASGSETIPSGANNQRLFASVDANPDSANVTRIVLEDTTASEVLYDVAVDGSNGQYILKVPLDSEHNTRTGNTIQATAHFSTSTAGELDLAVVAGSDHSHTTPDHTHPVDPGVSTFSNTTASGVDVLVNGTEVATDIGSGSFEATVDISGSLTKGAFNTVELTSDSTGWLYATAGLEAYRQIGSS